MLSVCVSHCFVQLLDIVLSFVLSQKWQGICYKSEMTNIN